MDTFTNSPKCRVSQESAAQRTYLDGEGDTHTKGQQEKLAPLEGTGVRKGGNGRKFPSVKRAEDLLGLAEEGGGLVWGSGDG